MEKDLIIMCPSRRKRKVSMPTRGEVFSRPSLQLFGVHVTVQGLRASTT